MPIVTPTLVQSRGFPMEKQMGHQQSTTQKNETVADRTRSIADRVEAMPDEVVKSFKIVDPLTRQRAIQEICQRISFDFLPVLSWIERRRTVEAANMMRNRVFTVLEIAFQCSGMDIPEYADGVISRVNGADGSEGIHKNASNVVTAIMTAALLRDWATDMEAAEHSPSSDRPTIIHLGQKLYKISRSEPIVVTDVEDAVLQAFIKNPGMDNAQLVEKSGYPNAANILRAFVKKHNGIFAPAIRLPGGKGKGGYSVAITNKP